MKKNIIEKHINEEEYALFLNFFILRKQHSKQNFLSYAEEYKKEIISSESEEVFKNSLVNLYRQSNGEPVLLELIKHPKGLRFSNAMLRTFRSIKLNLTIQNKDQENFINLAGMNPSFQYTALNLIQGLEETYKDLSIENLSDIPNGKNGEDLSFYFICNQKISFPKVVYDNRNLNFLPYLDLAKTCDFLTYNINQKIYLNYSKETQDTFLQKLKDLKENICSNIEYFNQYDKNMNLDKTLGSNHIIKNLDTEFVKLFNALELGLKFSKENKKDNNRSGFKL